MIRGVAYVRGSKTLGIGRGTLNLLGYSGLANTFPTNKDPKTRVEFRKNLAIPDELTEGLNVEEVFKGYSTTNGLSLNDWMVERRIF